MIKQIKKELAHRSRCKVGHRFKNGRIVFYLREVGYFNGLTHQQKAALNVMCGEYGGVVCALMGTLSIDPLKQGFDCDLTIKQILSLPLEGVFSYLCQFCKVKNEGGIPYVEYKGWAFYHEVGSGIFGASKIND